MESLYKLVKKLISYLYTILLNKLCATDQILLVYYYHYHYFILNYMLINNSLM